MTINTDTIAVIIDIEGQPWCLTMRPNAGTEQERAQ